MDVWYVNIKHNQSDQSLIFSVYCQFCYCSSSSSLRRLLNLSVCVSPVLVCSASVSGDVVIVVFVLFPQSVAAVLVRSAFISLTQHIEIYYRKLYYYYVLDSPLGTLYFPGCFGLLLFLFWGIFTVITRRFCFSYANFYDYFLRIF